MGKQMEDEGETLQEEGLVGIRGRYSFSHQPFHAAQPRGTGRSG